MHITNDGQEDGRARPHWAREALAGCAGALATVPVVLTLGLLAFSALGAAALQVGLLAAFVTESLGSIVHATLSRTSLPTSTPSSATALTLAASGKQ